MYRSGRLVAGAVAVPLSALILGATATSQSKAVEASTSQASTPAERGRRWLTANQLDDGSWGGSYSIAIASFASLA